MHERQAQPAGLAQSRGGGRDHNVNKNSKAHVFKGFSHVTWTERTFCCVLYPLLLPGQLHGKPEHFNMSKGEADVFPKTAGHQRDPEGLCGNPV